MKEKEKIYVISGSLREYKLFVLQNGGNFFKYVFISDAEQLAGLIKPEIVYVGQYWKNQAFKSGIIPTLYKELPKRQNIFQSIWNFLIKRR